jgi:hypothetical protein
MEKPDKQLKTISRRGLIPLLFGSLLLPYFGIGATTENPTKNSEADNGDEYQTLLKSDGSVVRVRKKVVTNAKVVRKNVSNKALLSWLNKK